MTAQITALPTPPSTNDPANFNTRADAFLGQMPTFVTEANALAGEVNANAVQTAADRVQTALDRALAATALGSPGTNGSSATSLSIGTGTRTFTTQTGKAWVAGQGFFLASTASPLNWMSGTLTAYNSATGAATLEVDTTSGTGTFAAWNCGLAAGKPYALASQAEAQGGVDNSKVMTPLRTVQAMRATQAPASVTAATSLTATSAVFQVANMPARGLAVTLPDATTVQPGHAFKIANSGVYDLPIKDATGATKAFVRPGKTATGTLSANTATAGVWVFEDVSIYGCAADIIIQNALNSAMADYRVSPIDASRDLITFTTNAGSLRCLVYDRINNVAGGVITIQASVSSYQVVVVNASTALATYSQGNATLVAVTLSISGVAATLNTPLSLPNFMPSIDNIWEVNPVGGSYVFRAWSNSAAADYAFACLVTGTTPSIGSAVQIDSPGTNAYDPSSCFASLPIGSNAILFLSTYNVSYIAIRYCTVSGANLTYASGQNTAQDSGQTPFKVEPLSTGRFLLMFTQSGTVYGQLLSISGSTLSASTPLSLGALTPSAGYGLNGAGSGVLVALPAGRALCGWINPSTGVANWVVLADTAGVLSAGAMLTRSADFTASGAVAKIGISGTTVYLARATASAFGEFYALDCAGATPVLVDCQRFSTGLDPLFGLASYSPQNKLRYRYMQSNVLQGGAGIFGLAQFNTNGSSTPCLSVWAFNPYPRRIAMDSSDGWAFGYGNVTAGSQLNEVWVVAGAGGRTLHLKRIECIA